ncbi:MAG: MoxR family ATPase [Bacteroidota bacterium]
MNIDDLNEIEEINPDGVESQRTIPETEEVPQPLSPLGNSSGWQQNRIDLSRIEQAVDRIKGELHKVIIGQDDMIDQLLIALFAGGHVLLEGVPGIAKTLTAKSIARSMDVDFSRIQFTPDLMPTDVVGTNVFNMQSSQFSFNKGPVFSNIVLIDEINRAPAKTQAALFEVMEEFQVTVDGETYKMDHPFIVIATQNPIEQEGTYKLPEAQLDRFLFKINMHYPSLEEEQSILRRFRNDFGMRTKEEVQKVFNAEEVKACRDLVEQVTIKDELIDYIAAIIHNTRNNGDLFLGASPRASLAVLKTSKAFAAMNGRDFVTPDDIQYVVYPALNHRIILTPEREMEGFDTRSVIEEIIKKIEVPR